MYAKSLSWGLAHNKHSGSIHSYFLFPHCRVRVSVLRAEVHFSGLNLHNPKQGPQAMNQEDSFICSLKNVLSIYYMFSIELGSEDTKYEKIASLPSGSSC